MFNPHLSTFVRAVDCGSFTKAADQLFISPTAVMKQVNLLEAHLKLKLIQRTSRGIRLTPAGEVIYKDAKFLFEYSKRSVESAWQAMETDGRTFRVGTSLLNPAKPFMDLWYRVNRQFPDYKLHLVPFEDDHTGILAEIAGLGEKFDFLMAICDSKLWLDQCHMLPPVPLQKDVRCIAGTPAGREKTACAFRFIRRDLDDGQAGRFQNK